MSPQSVSAPLLAAWLLTPLAHADPHVLIIGLDGVRADTADVMLNAGQLPNMQSLINNGLYSNRATTSDITGSWGGWSDTLRGVFRDEHQAGYWGSGGVQNVSPSPSHPDLVGAPGLFERVETYNGSLNTVSYLTWQNLHDSMDSSSSSAGIDRGADLRNFTDYNSDGDNVVTTQAVNYLSATGGGANPTSTNNPDLVFFYQADPDIAGHNSGFGPDAISNNLSDFSTGYRNELIETDNNVGQVLTALNDRPGVQDGSEEWLIILTSDHGGTNGGHSQNRAAEREVPFIMTGINTPVVQQTPTNNPLFVQPKLVDIVPTVLDHLDVPTSDVAWDGLRGHVVGGTASEQPAIAPGANLVFNGDAEYDRGFNGHNELIKASGAWDDQRDWPTEGTFWDQDVSGWDDWTGVTYSSSGGITRNNSMTVMYYGSGGGYPVTTDAGPADRGDNFFSSGIDGFSSMTQRIDVSSIATQIDADAVDFDMAAYLGGYAAQQDTADFAARFIAADGSTVLNTVTLLGPDADERGDATSLLLRQLTGDVTTGTRYIEFVLSARGGNGNDGYADNLRFSVNVPEPTSLALLGASGLALTRRRTR